MIRIEDGLVSCVEVQAWLREMAKGVLMNNSAPHQKGAAFHMHNALNTAAIHLGNALKEADDREMAEEIALNHTTGSPESERESA